MRDPANAKILGAFLIGFAFVGGAYTINSLQTPNATPTNNLAAVNEAPPRNFISVKDSNDDGVEDWQEAFVTSDTIAITSEDSTYTEPNTLTGQLGISFIERVVASKGYGQFGDSGEEIVTDTVKTLGNFATDKIFDVRDIKVSEDLTDEGVRLYGNQAALAIMLNTKPELKNEALILRDVLSGQNPGGVKDLETLARVYLDIRDDTLAIPVPKPFIKEHLDLINVYNALYRDIEGMSKALSDPALSLVRVKRYEDDALGLSLALGNLYEALEPYARVFENNDPALVFSNFSERIQ